MPVQGDSQDGPASTTVSRGGQNTLKLSLKLLDLGMDRTGNGWFRGRSRRGEVPWSPRTSQARGSFLGPSFPAFRLHVHMGDGEKEEPHGQERWTNEVSEFSGCHGSGGFALGNQGSARCLDQFIGPADSFVFWWGLHAAQNPVNSKR